MTATAIQSRSEERSTIFPQPPLASEQHLPQMLPQVLGSGDLTALLLVNVFWVSNITPISAGGPVVFLYWIACSLGFFVPCSLVLAQLAVIFPYEGSIYNWTFHCIGKTWAIFVSICTWLPGILSILNASVVVISCLQTAYPDWLTVPWQQGCALLIILLFVGLFSIQRIRIVQSVINVATVGMLLATLLVTAAALLWLFTGHPSATKEWSIPPISHLNLGIFGNTTLALLGSNIPLALIGETSNREHAIRSHLAWGTILTLAGYLLWTFALLTVQGAQAAASQANPIVLLVATVATVFGPFLGKLLLISLAFYYLIIAVTLNLCYSRLLLAVAVDGHLPTHLARLNVHRVPVPALLFQVGMVAVFAAMLYFLVPSFTGLGHSASDLNSIAYNVIGASLTLIWALSSIAPFACVLILSVRERQVVGSRWFLSLPVLAVCVCSGTLTLGASIITTLLNSFIPTLIPNTSWWYIIALTILVCLAFCLLSSMYGNSAARYEQLQG